MTTRKIPGGTVHTLPADLRRAIASNAAANRLWTDITPLKSASTRCAAACAGRAAGLDARIVEIPLSLGIRADVSGADDSDLHDGILSTEGNEGSIVSHARPRTL
jgi:hypothetical protein